MPPTTDNPFLVAAYVVGALISLPFIGLLVKGITFVSRTSQAVDALTHSVSEIKEQLKEKDSESHAHAWSFAIVEADINELQQKAGVEVRAYPDRRAGPRDRRDRP